ncbi:hypothetical protein CU098_002623 [Rhizopus stolonifer]|uniref:Homoserine kinase n=1 Tax=Rhizopus stolonifer TaxID=4846 RepID=A0A367JZ06_RHIST|nr:hypothetical protein CU098_002623 [Rhizopus stolonifer]
MTIDAEILKEGKDFEMTYSGEGAKDVPLTPEHNLITKTALYVLSANGISEFPKPLKLHVDNAIPLSRGLGSSGAAVVGGVLLGNALGQLNLSRDRLLDYCLMIERHPDNVAAALMGGFVASYLRELDPNDMKGVPASESLLDIALSQQVPQPPIGIGHYINLDWAKEIRCIAIVPQFEVATAKARAVLPTQYERHDMIFNFQRLAVLTTALGRSPPSAELIYNAMQDKVHQPYRKTLIPGLPEILSTITYQKYDGLLGICLSGAGPTILALATKNFDEIAEAAIALFKQHGNFECSYKILDVVTEVQALDYGAMCDPTPLYRESWQYDDSCEDVYLYCDPSTNTCNYKGCSNADYIAGWDTKVRPLPVRCNSSTYCPDNNSKCTPTVPTGQRCEIQRDDECSGNNAICLNSTCFIKGAPLGGNCGSDLTVYITYDAAGDSLQQTIIRDNCTDGTYCFSAVCIESKVNDSPCEQDRECLSGTCSNGGICINGPEVFHKIQPWLWGVLGAAVVIFVLLVLGLLWILHRYQSKQEHQKITKFFGDNEEFAKYAMMNDDDDSYYDNDSRTNLPLNDSRNLVYLTTPDYRLSQALTVGSKSASTSALNLSSSNSTPRLSSTTNIASRTRATPSNEI